jgi:hypothetical protein
MPTISVKRGIEFKKDLYTSRDRTPWLQEVGKELEANGVKLKLGEGAGAVEIGNGDQLVEFYKNYKADPQKMAEQVGLPVGRDLQEYVTDLMQALDDVVKDTSALSAGDTIDLTTTSDLSKVLGIDDKAARYASGSTEFGKSVRADDVSTVLGVHLTRMTAAEANDPLRGQMYIDATTFTQGGSTVTGRDSLEFESVRRLGGLDAEQVLALARSERNGRPVFARMRKASDSEAFSLGYSGIGFDKMRWDSGAHRVREANPFVSLTVESNRLELDEDDNEYEVSQGTDYFADTIYVAKDPADASRNYLADAGVQVRKRLRYDEPGALRRALIQTKVGSEVEGGMKSAAKSDIRRDSPNADDIAAMDKGVKEGRIKWGWQSTEQPIEPMADAYRAVSERVDLPDIGDHKDVMQLEEGAHIFSIRSRYHLNETNTSSMRSLYNQGAEWLGEIKGLVEASATMPQADKDSLTAMVDGITSKEAILERTKDALAAMDPDLDVADVDMAMLDTLMPTASRSSDKLTSRKKRVVADAIKSLHNELAEAIDDARREVADVRTPNGRDPMADEFGHEEETIDFMKQKFPDMATITTIGPFIKKLDEQLGGADKDAFIKELGEYLQNEENEDGLVNAADPDAAVAGIRKNMVSEHLEILHRQVEASGTMAQALWFDDVRAVYTEADRTTWNFLIDTFDFVTNITPEDWNELKPEQKDGREEIPADKIYNADIIAEVQIELGYEKDYVDTIKRAKGEIDGARAGLLMDFALEHAADTGAVADQPATFTAFVDSLKGQGDSDRQAKLDELTAFAADKGSPLTFDDESMGRLTEEMYTAARQGQPTDGHAGLVENLTTSEWIWETLRNTQEYVADLRGNRVMREAGRAGVSGGEWIVSEQSKGEKALAERPT